MTVIRQYNPSTSQWEVVAVGQAGNQGVTGPSGPAGATGPRQHVGTTPPASPTSGDQWYNSELGRQFVYYDNYWIEVGNAFRGDPGLVASTTAPTDTNILWLDTDDDSDGRYVPAGGASGAILRKSSSADYDIEWSGAALTADGITAKGDLLSGTSAGQVGKTSVGTNGFILVADSSQNAGITWKKNPAGDQLAVYPNTVDSVNVWTGGGTGQLNDTGVTVKGMFLLRAALISTMQFYVGATTGAGATLRTSIYGDDGFGRPGSLLWDSGAIDASTTGFKTVTGINTWASAGMIYIGVLAISGTISVIGNAGSTSGNEAYPKGTMGDNLPRGGRYTYVSPTAGTFVATPTWSLANGGGQGVAMQFGLTFSQVIQ